MGGRRPRGARERLDIADVRAGRGREPAGGRPPRPRRRARTRPAAAAVRGRTAARATPLEARRPERDAAAGRAGTGPQGGARRARAGAARRRRAGPPRRARGPRAGPRRAAAGRSPTPGAEQLAALERKLRQELGGLDAARRAERRSAEIDPRAGRTWSARPGPTTTLLQDAAGWLAGWETARRTYQERIAAAQEAATRAEHLAGRLEPARRTAATRPAHATGSRRAPRSAEDAAALRPASARTRAHESWLDLQERRLRGIAAELAAGLVDGEACAVCGSADHPAPARAGDGHVDRAAEEAAYADYTRADAARTDAERELAVVGRRSRRARDEARTGAAPRPGPEDVTGAESRPGRRL